MSDLNAADHSFQGYDPLENSYDPAVAEKQYRDRITTLMEENERLRAENERLKGWLRWFHETGQSSKGARSERSP